MSFIRPEAAAVLTRWREVIVALCVVALGLWIATRPGGWVLPAFGWVLAVAGAAYLPVAIRRARFVARGDGPGVVTLSEGRVTYMGPHWGGVVSLDELASLGLRHDPQGPVWLLREGGTLLEIPVDALHAEGLFDAFARLPGLSSARLLAALEDRGAGPRMLWTRTAPPALTPPGPRSTS